MVIRSAGSSLTAPRSAATSRMWLTGQRRRKTSSGDLLVQAVHGEIEVCTDVAWCLELIEQRER